MTKIKLTVISFKSTMQICEKNFCVEGEVEKEEKYVVSLRLLSSTL